MTTTELTRPESPTRRVRADLIVGIGVLGLMVVGRLLVAVLSGA